LVLTAKHLTNADIGKLDGRVSTILKRGSSGAADVLNQLHVVLKKRPIEP
jgi:hypothetical protein